MVRYIDAEPMLREAIEERKFVFATEDAKRNEIIVRTVYKDLYEFIESQPTADVVEVVRCKDCKYCTKAVSIENTYFCVVGTNAFDTELDNFCSYGERSDT